jgi:hypothetical protein
MNLWTWCGIYFGCRDGDELWAHSGHHVGRFYGSEIYGPDGHYLGEVVSNGRLITSKGKCAQRRDGFTPAAPRVAWIPSLKQRAYPLYAAHQDFPDPVSFDRLPPDVAVSGERPRNAENRTTTRM